MIYLIMQNESDRKRLWMLIAILVLCSRVIFAQTQILFDDDWQFHDELCWPKPISVNLPHDWDI